MKRKLDVNDAPSVEVSAKESSFESFNLDPRLLQAVANSGFKTPTAVQAKAIPLALEGKDVLAKSKTGSGKTAAYVLPILQSILSRKAKNPKEKATVTIVLVPTIELSDQVTKAFSTFSAYCSKEIKALNLTQRLSDAVLNAKLQELPDIVVSTPGRASQLVSSGALSLQNIQRFVVDEADLVLAYDGGEDINEIAKALPKGVQTFLLSATLSPEVDQLKGVLCRDPVVVKIDSKEEKGEGITQYVVKCGEEEKFLLIFVIFKLKLVKGKCIIFVADVDRSYRLKLYLEQYGIKSCVLNSELPVNSRLHTVEEFNKGLYDILIAADDQEVIGGIHRKSKSSQDDQLEAEVTDEEDELDNDNDINDASERPTKKPRLEKSKDYGVSRGIDFQNVSCVLNFDLPTTSKSYTHRIGRTARAGQSGTSISFVIPRSEYKRHKPTTHPSTRSNEKTLTKIIEKQTKKGNKIHDYIFDMKAVEGFRYRMNDALRAVTRVAVREARAREIKQELIRSEKLRKHFEENPEDLRYLQQRRTDNGSLGGGGVIRVQNHMKHVPDYLLPGGSKQDANTNGENGTIATGTGTGTNGDSSSIIKKKRKNGFNKKSGKRFIKGGGNGGRKNDPLKTFRSRK